MLEFWYQFLIAISLVIAIVTPIVITIFGRSITILRAVQKKGHEIGSDYYYRKVGRAITMLGAIFEKQTKLIVHQKKNIFAPIFFTSFVKSGTFFISCVFVIKKKGIKCFDMTTYKQIVKLKVILKMSNYLYILVKKKKC